MVIRAKRIRKLGEYIRLIPAGNNVVVGVANPDPGVLARIGFPQKAAIGESVLPTPFGPVTLFNAEGKEIVHKDQPMETAYRTVEWHWTEWHGRDRVERSDFRDVPYLRYPRTPVAPPGLEVTIVSDAQGNKVARAPLVHNWRKNETLLVHAINLLLEIFGECAFYDATMRQLVKPPIKRLNWHILPPGERPWAQLKTEVKAVLDAVKGGNRPVVEHRLETINAHKPSFAAVGVAGFRGYIILGFPERNLFVLESLFYGNATYVFGESWKELSKKTKAEILNQELQEARFVHVVGWDKKINELLRPRKGRRRGIK